MKRQMHPWKTVAAATWFALATAPLLAAEPSSTPAKLSPADQKAYDQVSAHQPDFANRVLWPSSVVDQTAYAKQAWPKARVLVWAHPGNPARDLDATSPKNWLEDGKPASRGFDPQTDLVLPDSETPYHVLAKQQTLACRHLTIGRNARASMQKLAAHGNVWIKAGGRISWLEEFTGDKNTFHRNDNPAGSPSMRIANKLTISKTGGAAAEIVGCFETGDDLNLVSGTMIVGPDAVFHPGDRSTQGIFPEAALVLLSGSEFGKRGNQHYTNEMVVAGKLLAGTPERPLTRDCRLGLSFKNKTQGDVRLRGSPDFYGLVVLPQGVMQVYSADPAKARLVVRWHGRPRSSGVGGDPGDIPHQIDCVFLAPVQLNGVEFNDVRPGGILLADPALRNTWKNVFFGRNNAGPPDTLFRKYAGPTEFKLLG